MGLRFLRQLTVWVKPTVPTAAAIRGLHQLTV